MDQFNNYTLLYTIFGIFYLVQSENCANNKGPTLKIIDLVKKIDDYVVPYAPDGDMGYISIPIKKTASLNFLCESTQPVDLQFIQQNDYNPGGGIDSIKRFNSTHYQISYDKYNFINGTSQSTFICKHVNNSCLQGTKVLEIYNSQVNSSSRTASKRSVSAMRLTIINGTGNNVLLPLKSLRKKSCSFQFYLKLDIFSNSIQANCSYFENDGVFKYSFRELANGYAPTWEAVLRKEMTDDSCLTILKEPDQCLNCIHINMTQYRPIVLRCSYQNHTGQQFAFFPLEMNFDRQEAAVYNTWNDLPNNAKHKMIHIDLNVPSNGLLVPFQELQVSCTFSDFYFSYGYILQIKGKNNKILETVKGYGKYDKDLKAQKLSHTFRVPIDLEEIICFGPVWNETIYVKNSKLILLEEVTKPIFDVQMEKVYFEIGSKTAEITCSAKSIEQPNYRWDLQNITTKEDLYKVISSKSSFTSIQFLKVNKDIQNNYTCFANNSAGTVFKQFSVFVNEPPTDLRWIFWLTGVLVIVTLLVFMNGYLLMKYRKERKKSPYFLPKQDINYFLYGLPAQINSKSENEPVNWAERYRYYSEIYKKPYDNRLEIPYRYWKIERHKKIGEGKFGQILQGVVECDDIKVEIAVKIPKIQSTSIDPNSVMKSMLTELKILVELEPHPNIIKLIAANTEKLHRSKILIGLEYCEHGSIWKYLRKNTQLFCTEIENGSNDGSNLHIFPSGLQQLMKWTLQLCQGLDFLHNNRIAHRDLAARNCLLSRDMILKICDFGMALEISLFGPGTNKKNPEKNNPKHKNKNQLVPWKWLAPELFEDNCYITFSSDIWSLGITLFEIWSLSATPYPTDSYCEEFILKLKNGYRLPRPFLASNDVYEIILLCWDIDPKERPTSAQLYEKFHRLVTVQINNDSGYQDVSVLA